MAGIQGKPIVEIIENGIGSMWDDYNKPQKELEELREWLSNAHPEVFKQYQCIKDITE